MSRFDLVVIVVAFLASHLSFWLLSLGMGEGENSARAMFEELNLAGALLPAVATIFTSVIMAPVCEELLYRGAMLRPVHDHLARRGARTWVAAAVGIAVSAVLFAMPHLGDESGLRQSVAYLLTGVTFGLVYVLTGSMTAAMVSHSLQSAAAFGQVLFFGRGDDPVSPILWILVLGCPIWVYLVARGLHAVLPKGRAAR